MTSTPLPSGEILRAEYESGTGITKLCRRYRHCWPASYVTIWRRLQAAGTAMRGKGNPRGTVLPNHHNRKVSVNRIPDVLIMALKTSQNQAAKAFGITPQRVSQIVAAHG